ncbi:MAG: BatD family protein [Candidatus Neomarinimicrobiota bacterium]
MKRKYPDRRNRFLAAIVLLLPLLIFAQVQVTANVDANRIGPNETFTFKIETSGAGDFPDVDISPLLDDFALISGPAQQTYTQWVNGKMSSSRNLSWTFMPRKSGQLTIPALNAQIGRKTYPTQPISIVVSGDQASTAGSTSDVFLIVELDKDQVYPGEQITVTYKLYTRANLRGLERIADPKNVGFWVEDIYAPSQPQFRGTMVEGVSYSVATLYKAAMFPTKTGNLKISPMVIRCQVEVAQARRSRRSLFDDFFNDPFAGQAVNKIVSTDTTIINVQPFPGGRPTDFTGAVGEFSITATTDRSSVTESEAVAYTIKLAGTGNLNRFELPNLEFPDDLEVYPPTTEFEKDAFRDQFSGTITREYILIPRAAGEFRLPRVRFSYFDPKQKKWAGLSTQPIALKVNPGKDQAANRGDLTKEEVALLGKDIRYINTAMPNWYRTGRTAVSLGLFFLYFAAVVFYSGPVLYRNYLLITQSSAGSRRSRNALKNARQRLSRPATDVYSQVAGTIYHYLGEKLDLTSAELDPNNVDDLLDGQVEPGIRAGVIGILQSCDAGRFAPGATATKTTLITDTLDILQRLDAEL